MSMMHSTFSLDFHILPGKLRNWAVRKRLCRSRYRVTALSLGARPVWCLCANMPLQSIQLGNQTTPLCQEKHAPFSRQCHPAPGNVASRATLGLAFTGTLLAQCTTCTATEGNPAQERAVPVSSRLGPSLRIWVTLSWPTILTAS